MRKRIKFSSNYLRARTISIRHRFSLGFFSIVFPFFLITLGILYQLDRHGISFYKIPNPAMATLIISILCLILGYVASFYLLTKVFRPLEQLSEASQQIANGNYDVRVEYDGSIAELAHTIENFNFMVQELNSVEIISKDFIANVSHEFKTPLSSISGYVTLLQDPELTADERSEYIQMAFFNIEKLNDLTGNILQLSKLEHQNTLNNTVTYRLDEQIREAIVLLEPRWSQKEINLELDLPSTIYCGQQALLFQVWTNLIGNAIKFSNQNDTISIRLGKKRNDIEVIVSDNGIGMSAETMAHMFDKFYQGDSSRRSQGSGLGLALCKKILDLCDGRIYVSSEPEKGSTFLVRLPMEET
ncbi:MAG: HAMP domain-containing histidine kinase [Lachnospiraceae bacterium]|nr:HAMP domain-containing histidine kinase [Lachnospiraceae bacterium]